MKKSNTDIDDRFFLFYYLGVQERREARERIENEGRREKIDKGGKGKQSEA